jgi:hypothetical protein
MRTPAQIISDTAKDAKNIPGLVAMTLVVVQMIEGKIAAFNFVALTSEAAALAELTEMIKTGWIAIGVYIITASSNGQVRQVSSGPLREFIGNAQVVKFLTDLVDCSAVYYKAPESPGWTRVRRLKQVRNRQNRAPDA